jgi:hypothetical protein
MFKKKKSEQLKLFKIQAMFKKEASAGYAES